MKIYTREFLKELFSAFALLALFVLMVLGMVMCAPQPLPAQSTTPVNVNGKSAIRPVAPLYQAQPFGAVKGHPVTTDGSNYMGTSMAATYADAFCSSSGVLDHTCIANAAAASPGQTIIVPNLSGSSVYNMTSPITISQSHVRMQFQKGVTLHNTTSTGCAMTITGTDVEMDDLVIEAQPLDTGYNVAPLCITGSNITLVNLTVTRGSAYVASTNAVTISGSNVSLVNPTIDANLGIYINPPSQSVYISGGNVGYINGLVLSGGGALSNINVRGVHGTAQGYDTTCITVGDFSTGSVGQIANIWYEDNTCSVVGVEPLETITGFSISNGIATITAPNQFFAGEQLGITGLSTGTYLNGLTRVLSTGLSSTQFQVLTTHTNVAFTADSGTADSRPFGAISIATPNLANVFVSHNSFSDPNQYLQGIFLETGWNGGSFDHNTITVSDAHSQSFNGLEVYSGGNVIEGNTFVGGSRNGNVLLLYPQLAGNVGGASGNNNVVRGNVFTATSPVGAAIASTCNYSSGGSALNNVFEGNVFSGSYSYGITFLSGYATTCVITGQVVGNTFSQVQTGISNSNATVNSGANVYNNVQYHTSGAGTYVTTY